MEKHIGGWCLHNKCNPSKDFKMSKKCKVCNSEFEISSEKNLKTKNVLIYITTEYEYRRKGLFKNDRYSRGRFEKACLYKSICPNCNKKSELFCSSENEIFLGEWEIDNPWDF